MILIPWGYVEPVFTTNVGLRLIAFSIAWLAIGAYLLSKTRRVLRALVFCYFPIPAALVLTLTPAITHMAMDGWGFTSPQQVEDFLSGKSNRLNGIR